MKRILAILLITAVLLVSCVPLGSEYKSVSIAGKGQSQFIERREINKKFLAIISPDGFFYRGHFTSVEYWLNKENKKYELSHLDRLNQDKTLREMFNVSNSNIWIAFDLGEVTRESVQINIVVFDEKGIRHVQSIADCKRLDLCAEHFLSLQSYAITLNNNNSVLLIETLAGPKAYDVINGKLNEHDKNS